ncbi:hypothetical protein ACH4S8_37940 [Streptomyces sp. NPDC021080]|uniref:hypothetical protein n=1 Tax=Streptomyces sp. NPDC021080 TaxID=3365110 RepID=UPI00379897C7
MTAALPADPDAPVAAVYLRHLAPILTSDDLSRLFRLRAYAQECGYAVDAAVTAHDPEGSVFPPVTYQLLRRALQDEDIDAIVLWHDDLDVPDILARADITAADHGHVWVTALDGDDRPALDADGRTWELCGICGDPRDGVVRPSTAAVKETR